MIKRNKQELHSFENRSLILIFSIFSNQTKYFDGFNQNTIIFIN